MAGRNIGEALVSVADVKILDAITGVEIGEATALTSSGIESTTQNTEVSGGYLNALLFDIRFGRRVNITLESPTFKMEYLAYQTGNPISRAIRDVYEFNDYFKVESTTITLTHEPTATVHLLFDGVTELDVTAVGSEITVPAEYIGSEVAASYFYGGEFDSVEIDTVTEPMTVKLMMNVHSRKQDGSTGFYQVSIPLFKFDGNFNLAFTSDGVSSMAIAGSSLAYSNATGKSKYCDFTYIPDDEVTSDSVIAIAPLQNSYIMESETVTPVIIGVRQTPYENFIITKDITFSSEDESIATVDASTGEITFIGSAGDNTDIVATYGSHTCRIAVSSIV